MQHRLRAGPGICQTLASGVQTSQKLSGKKSCAGLKHLYVHVQVRAAEIPAAKQLLGSLVQLLPDLTTVDEHDVRMQGKLELLLQLISVLGSHTLLSNESQQLVQLLLTGITHDATDSMLKLRLAYCMHAVCLTIIVFVSLSVCVQPA